MFQKQDNLNAYNVDNLHHTSSVCNYLLVIYWEIPALESEKKVFTQKLRHTKIGNNIRYTRAKTVTFGVCWIILKIIKSFYNERRFQAYVVIMSHHHHKRHYRKGNNKNKTLFGEMNAKHVYNYNFSIFNFFLS